MSKNITVAVIIGIAIIVGIVAIQMSDTIYQKSSTEEYYDTSGGGGTGTHSVAHVVYPDNPQFLYGMKINKDKYVLGENVFVSLTGIPMGLKDSVVFISPEGKEYYEMKFDGKNGDYAKEYFRPMLLKALEICDKDKLIGEWRVMFKSVPNEYLKFEIVNEMLPNNELYYDGCGPTGQEFVVDPTRMDTNP